MPHARRTLLVLLVALVPAVLPPCAPAAFFPGDTVDGPSADIVGIGDVDVARDGSGAVVYLRREGGVPHVFASRLVGGRWSAPERVDAGFDAAASAPVVAASDGGRLVVAFVAGGDLFSVVRPAGAATWPAVTAIPGGGSATTPSLDMSLNGVAYVVWTGAGDVHAARLERNGGTFSTIDAPLDIDPARVAGDGDGRPRVAVSADGTGLATWGEAGHVYARRLFELRLTAAPQDLTLDSLEGHAGTAAALPDVDMQDDSSYAWIVFRETFDDGSTHVVARRLVGSAFDPPLDVGGGGFGGESADDPRVDTSGRGETIFASDTSGLHTPVASLIHLRDFIPPAAVGSGGALAPRPQPAVAENGSGVVAWLTGTDPAGAGAAVAGRQFVDAKPAGDGALSAPGLGAVDPDGGFDAGANRAGDVVVLYVQGAGDERRVVSAGFDRPPASFVTFTTSRWRRPGELRWAESFDLWGPVTYTLMIDGKAAGTTTTNRITPAPPIGDGIHRWRVAVTDRRGQAFTSRLGTLRIDGTPPAVALTISGVRKAGRLLKLTAHVADRPPAPPAPPAPVAPPAAPPAAPPPAAAAPPPPARGAGGPRAHAAAVATSGVKYVSVRFGDGTRTLYGTRFVHVYGRGSFTVTVTAVDAAGNQAVLTRRLVVRR